MGWLVDRFGAERMLQAEVATPDQSFWGSTFDGTEAAARQILQRLEEHLGLPTGKIPLEVVDDVQLPGTAGRYDSSATPRVRIKRSLLSEILPLTSVLAHELMHDLLLGGKHPSPEEADLEATTDLATVFFGLGIFPANSSVRFEATHVTNWESWSIARYGYLPSRMLGYALALFAWWRNENSPAWSRHLRPDAAEVFHAARPYLQSTDDCLFHPHVDRREDRELGGAALLRRLEEYGPTYRLAALKTIGARKLDAPNIREALVKSFRDRNPGVAVAAVETFAALGSCSDGEAAELYRLLATAPQEVRYAAVEAIGRLQAHPAESLIELESLVLHDDRTLARIAVSALARFGGQASPYVKQILQLQRRALVDCDELTTEAAVTALLAVAQDPRQEIRNFYREYDDELLNMALGSLTRHTPLLLE